MRWQPVARVVVAAAGLGAATTLYLKTRERPAPVRPSAGTVADPLAMVQAGDCKQIRYRDSSRQFTFEASSCAEMADGRRLSEGVKLTLEDGTVVSADRVESRRHSEGRWHAGGVPAEGARPLSERRRSRGPGRRGDLCGRGRTGRDARRGVVHPRPDVRDRHGRHLRAGHRRLQVAGRRPRHQCAG